MAPTPPTIVSLKQSFLTTQTRLLSQPLAPTRAWHSHNNNNNNSSTQDNNALPEKAIDDALFKLNHRLHQHSRRVYAPQATRHVAEQIDQLYWNAAEAATSHDPDADGDGDEPADGEGLTLGADLADPAIIATLPLEWDPHSSSSSPSSSAENPLDTKRYAELAGELHALAARKTQATTRVARLQRMRALLEPFGPAPPNSNTDSNRNYGGDGGNLESGGGGGGVQENLVTRNGEVEAELQRMRMLLARVGGRVGMVKEQGQRAGGGGGDADSTAGSLFSEPGGEDVGMDEQRKVGMLLERF